MAGVLQKRVATFPKSLAPKSGVSTKNPSDRRIDQISVFTIFVRLKDTRS